MLFNSLHFLIFFPIVTLLYYLLKQKYRWILLFIASTYFYSAFFLPYILILYFIIIIDYVCGIFIENSKNKTKLFYNTNGFWANSSFKGSLMLRPILGDSARAIGIKNNSVTKNQIKIFPNPASDIINVSTTHNISAIEILDASGKRVFDSKSNLLNQFNISALNNGFYFLKIYSNTQLLDIQKLIINRND